jgi:hypothetical protein
MLEKIENILVLTNVVKFRQLMSNWFQLIASSRANTVKNNRPRRGGYLLETAKKSN